MLFTELRFIVFFFALFAVYWMIQSRLARVVLLTLASFVFYGAWDARFLALIAAVIAVSYGAHLLLFRYESTRAKNWVTGVSVVFLLGLLGVFKYFDFFADSLVALAQSAGMSLSQPAVSIILPVGISFYIFQAIGFIVDVRRGEFPERQTLLDVAFFIAFFPQLVAGPIVRAQNFFPQIDIRHRLRDVPLKGVAVLFIGGLFKKAVIADNLAPLYVDPVFADPGLYSASAITLAVIAYAVQIYCDFSGYSDMAIAISRAFGYQLPVNFRAPYFSPTITEFWRRWHISLSNWLRDYLYISLGGNRSGVGNTYRNLMATMVLGGLWHGASWNFLFWGYMHGGLLALERLFAYPKKVATHFLLMIPAAIVTFILTCVAWVFFRSTNFDVSLFMIGAMFHLAPAGDISFSLMAWGLMALLGAMHYCAFRFELGQKLARLPEPVTFAVCGMWIALILALMPSEAQPFIYFQF